MGDCEVLGVSLFACVDDLELGVFVGIGAMLIRLNIGNGLRRSARSGRLLFRRSLIGVGMLG